MKFVLLFAPLLFAGLSLSTAVAAPFHFPRSTPEAQGVSSAALLKFVDEAGAKVDSIHSFMLVRHGQVVAEGWWSPYAADEPHLLFSLSKSFTSTAIGLAVAEGRLSIDDPVLKFFPEAAPASPDKNLQGMRVRDLLTMTTGHHEDVIADFFSSKDDLVTKFLALPVAHKPGTFFMYNTPATYMESAIVQKVTGQTTLDYLRPRLFEPLGIENPVWEASAQGISLGGYGMSARTEDIARFGQLYLQKGQWQGRQLVPAAWIEQASARQVSNGSDPAGNWDQGYGFNFWRCLHGFYRGDGAYGQFCIVMPQYDAVIAITSGTKDMALVMNLAWQIILPGLHDGRLPDDPAGQAKLKDRLAHLMLAPVEGAASGNPTPSGVYRFAANAAGIESVQWGTATGAGQPIVIRSQGKDEKFVVASGGWQKVDPRVAGSESDPIAASGAWTATDTFMLKLARYRTPYLVTYTFKVSGPEMTLDAEQNVGPANLKPVHAVGKITGL